MTSYTQNYRENVHNATAITTGSANQRPNTPCIRLWIDVTFRGPEHSYSPMPGFNTVMVIFGGITSTFDTTLFDLGSLMMVHYPKCA